MSVSDPRFVVTIPLTAGIVRWTPPALDPIGAFVKRLPLLEANARAAEARHIELLRQRDAGEIVGTNAEDLLADAAEVKIETTAAIADQRRAAEVAAATVGIPPVFSIRVPTSLERDQINVRLVSLGLTAVSDEQIRASMIETLYEIDWQRELNSEAVSSEAYADEQAAFMDGFWQVENIQQQAFARWRDEETERLLDAMEGAPLSEVGPKPARMISIRDEAKMQLLVARLMEEPRMRRILGKRLDHSRRNAVIIVRINLCGVDGLAKAELQRERFDDVLTDDSVNALREALVEIYGKAVGDQAWVELVGYIDGLYSVNEFERGNSDSPLEKPLDPTGSIVPNGDISNSAGNLMESPIDPAPVAGSETITARPSGSISECVEPIGSNGPMDAG